jgi:hypothetical protein
MKMEVKTVLSIVVKVASSIVCTAAAGMYVGLAAGNLGSALKDARVVR